MVRITIEVGRHQSRHKRPRRKMITRRVSVSLSGLMPLLVTGLTFWHNTH